MGRRVRDRQTLQKHHTQGQGSPPPVPSCPCIGPSGPRGMPSRPPWCTTAMSASASSSLALTKPQPCTRKEACASGAFDMRLSRAALRALGC